MLGKASKIQKDLPIKTEPVGSRQTPTSLVGDSLTTVDARSENPVDGRGEYMLCPRALEIETTYQVAYENLNLEKIEQRSLTILHASSSEYGIKSNHDDIIRHKTPQEENFSSKRSRFNKPQREKRGDAHESDGNVGAADQSDSMVKVSSGDSDLTAERMAEASSRTTTSSDNNNGCTLNPPPLSTTDAFGAAVNQLSYCATENFQVTSSDSGLHKLNFEDCRTVYRSDGFSPCSSNPVTDQKEHDWLALGLGCGYGNRQPKHFSNKRPHLDKPSKLKTSMIGWNEDKTKDDHGLVLPQQMFNDGHTSNLSTLLAPSSSTIPDQQLTFQNITYSMSQPFREANTFSLQKTYSDFSALNLLQPCSIEDQQRPQNIALFPTASAEHTSFNFQGQQSGETLWPSKEAAKWQAFYERISEARNPASADLGVSEPRIEGRHRFSRGWESLSTASAAAPSYQNSGSAGPASYGSIPDAGALQKAILEKTQCRAQWKARDNFSAWCQPGISVGSLIRPSASEISTRKISRANRMLTLGEQQYEVPPPPLEKNMPQGPSSELRKIPGPQWTDNVRIFRPARIAQTGVWFALKALSNQNGDRMLPQIRKNYLRIKDGTMTIIVVKKYLVNKLGLNGESEIEIMCRGEQLLASVTLQHVRDVIWSSKHEIRTTVASNHLMVLHYQRSPLLRPLNFKSHADNNI